jgi:type VI secretion system protein ImpL
MRLLRALRANRAGPSHLQAVILFCDCGQFTGIPDTVRQGAMARTANERLRLIGDAFGTDFPAYVVFTKSDAVPYFRDYFGRLPEGEDQQPLGCLLSPGARELATSADVYTDPESRRVAAAFSELYRSLTEHRLEFLAAETDPARKPGIYEFPRELKRIRSPLVQYLVEAFRPKPLQPGPVLRGWYFTGTRQVTRTVPARDLASSVSAGALAATRLFRADDIEAAVRGAEPDESVETRWTFVAQVFADVVMATEAPVVQNMNRGGQVYFKAAYAAAAVVSVALLSITIWSFWNNRRLLAGVEQAAIAARAREITPAGLDGIDRLRHQVARLAAYKDHTPWSMTVGLYQGNAVMPLVRELYFARFRDYFLRDVEQSLAVTLAGLPPAKAADFPARRVHERLNAYLTITNQGSSPERPAFPRLLTGIWSRRRNDDGGRAYPHFEFYAEALEQKRVPFTVEARQEWIARARSYLEGYGAEETR